LWFPTFSLLQVIDIDNIELVDEFKKSKKEGVKRFQGANAGQKVKLLVFWIVELSHHSQLAHLIGKIWVTFQVIG